MPGPRSMVDGQWPAPPQRARGRTLQKISMWARNCRGRACPALACDAMPAGRGMPRPYTCQSICVMSDSIVGAGHARPRPTMRSRHGASRWAKAPARHGPGLKPALIPCAFGQASGELQEGSPSAFAEPGLQPVAGMPRPYTFDRCDAAPDGRKSYIVDRPSYIVHRKS